MSSLANENVLIGGQRIACASFGAGEPVVLIHGTPSSSYIWRNVAPVLVQAGYRVHIFDLLGFGASERPADPAVDTSVSGQVPILESLMDVWGLESAHIVAHDIGGGVAQRFCIFHPERARTLTLIDTVSFDSWPSKRTKQQMQAGLDALIKAPDAEHRAHFRDWLLSTVVNKDRFAADALEIYVELISGPVGQASLFQHQVAHYDHRHTSEISDRLGELSNLPVQILWGEQDSWQVTDWAHKLHAAILGSALQLLPECGHFAMEDQPERISELVIGFVGGDRV
ncbi:alpha/beta hydrolase [Nisaea acidiphila]|uniref:Alpha/beta hydrolase n=1 Tax=Nisaea acidiphila TaxID=1862145 RepID=A0A9J7AV26_9PROT|nr:alpha/beta hydrolase [Nisaea acidiphila]UUX50658.1 alpha/beta hydrolase [Nisaea acidiphila]